MSPHAYARRPGSTRGGLRTVDGGSDDGRGGRQVRATGNERTRRPKLVPVSERPRRPGPGRMQKGETPKERGERTRARIAESVLDLLAGSDLPPTAKEIAAEAGVSVRLVFHHFEDMDALHRAVQQAQFERHWQGLRAVAPDLPLAQRIDRTVQQRAKLFEAVGPVRRKAVALAARHQAVADGLDLTNTMLRDWLEETFAGELRAAKRHRRELLAALEVASSWETWDHLRRVQKLQTAAARRIIVRTLHALLEA
jgi:TetR/AcrR family transcriptional regulator of autoinduction and epiphytic fitness